MKLLTYSIKCAFAVITLTTAFSLMAWGAIGSSTLGVDIEAAPGESVSGSFIVYNGDESPTRVRILLADFDRLENGGVQILPPESSPSSLAKYITFSPSEFTLPAGNGQSQQVTFTLNLPEDVTGPHWSMLLVQEIEDEEAESADEANEDGIQVEPKVSIQIGVQIRQVDPSNRVNDGRITEIEVLQASDEEPLRVVAQFENIGTTFQRPTGEVRIINSNGEIATRLDIAPFRTVPNSTRRLEIPVEADLPPGDYVALVIIDFGGDFMLAGQVRFTIN